LLALELALQLEAEGHKGKLYLVDSAPDYLKAMLTQSMAGNEDEFQTSLICTLFTLIAPHEATSAAVSKVYHERYVKSYEYWNALSFGVWPFKFVALTHSWGCFHSNSQFCSWSCYNYVVLNTFNTVNYQSIYKCPKFLNSCIFLYIFVYDIYWSPSLCIPVLKIFNRELCFYI